MPKAKGKRYRSKAPWLFKKGNKSFPNNTVGPESNQRLFQRLPNDLYIASKEDSLILPSILRPKIKQVDDHTPTVCAAQFLCDSNTQLNDKLSISSYILA